ncbi:hypothetical protein PG999_000247 [Apiospora kogelbergensis]|uniref:Rieske domain-containing protein n=1 Tax=Apiospora kogelbergensis TaxID=1337665 RepID=A0AAW0RB99_9PEZI
MATTLPFAFGNRRGDPWNFVGLASSFPNLDLDGKSVSERRSCNPKGSAPGCKVYLVPRASNTAGATEASEVDAAVPDTTTLKDQVLVFQYKGKFHAVDNVSAAISAPNPIMSLRRTKIDMSPNQRCPHSSYPLSRGSPFDIEDFGISLSSGISCPKHDWSFDLHTGQGDRGSYKLAIWEIDLRPVTSSTTKTETDPEDKEVWVRRKQKMG